MTTRRTTLASFPGAARAAVLRRPTLCAALLCLLSFAAHVIAQRAAEVSMVDLLVYRAEGWAARTGGDLYDLRATVYDLPNTYPPFAALVFTPLTLVSAGTLKALAVAVNLGLVVVLAHLALRLVGRPLAVPRPAAVLALSALAVWCEPVWTTFRWGQINLLVTVLVLWDLTRRQGHRWAGVGTGIAAGIKVTPALFVVFLAVAGLVEAVRRVRSGHGAWNEPLRRAATGTAAFAATVVSAAALLPRDTHRFWTEILVATDRPGFVAGTGNQNLLGVLARALHTTEPGLWWTVAAALVACTGLATAAAAQLAGDRMPNGRAWAAVVCAVTALLVSPVSWSHHWVWAVPLVLLLGVEAQRRRDARWAWGAVLSGLVFCSFMIWYVPHATPDRPELHQNVGQMLLSGAYPVLGLAVLAVAARLAVRAWRSAPPEPPEPRGLPRQRETGTAYVRG
ncbi:glycosyltransferase 87 family protein [Streptomyces sp. NPDC047108]|uniref:glycosyltransferase 87 family protein n=1 Tax=Streptomyces sp. NPDC047108 TaxID=3155025 RepID=UPI0033E944BC